MKKVMSLLNIFQKIKCHVFLNVKTFCVKNDNHRQIIKNRNLKKFIQTIKILNIMNNNNILKIKNIQFLLIRSYIKKLLKKEINIINLIRNNLIYLKKLIKK